MRKPSDNHILMAILYLFIATILFIMVLSNIPNKNEIKRYEGGIRNVDIWDNSDFGVAFWEGASKGTEHSFKLAKKQGKRLLIWNDKTKQLYENE